MSNSDTTRLVIFDCDGVLVDSEMIASQVLSEELAALGVPMTPENCRDRFTGVTMTAVIAGIEALLGRPLPDDFEETLQEKDFAAFERAVRPVDGVEAMLRGLAIPKCVASSGAIAKMHCTLTATGLLPLLEPHLFSAQMVAHGKPAPDLFLYAADRMGVPPRDCVVIEDSAAGIEAALAAEMPVIGFAGGSHADAGYTNMLKEAGAGTIIDHMSDLPRLLHGK
jgi:HAD superfamily hydrolase (TIGR01509 family)